jgi:alkylation response protein AidB-like acyl-CoA dehydrogenase
MDFGFSDDHRMLRDTMRDFAQNEVAPGAAERDKSHAIEASLLKQMAELGLMGICVPEEYGGSGMDCTAAAIVVEEISKACAGCGVCISAHNSLCVDPILAWGTEDQKRKYLPKLASGEAIGCLSLTEPGSGSDAGAARCMAVEKEDGWHIDGTKVFVTNGNEASVVLLAAVTDADNPKRRMSTFIIDKPSPGLSIAKLEEKLGIHCTSTAELLFEDCPVPKENMLGERGRGLRIALTTLDGGRIGIAAQALGIAEASLAAAVEYAENREQFHQPIGAFQAIQNKIADMVVQIEASRVLTYRAAWLKDMGKPYAYEAAQAKLVASETAAMAATTSLQIHGGYGYCEDYPVERYYRDAKITELYEGTSEIHRLVLARTLLDRNARVWETDR